MIPFSSSPLARPTFRYALVVTLVLAALAVGGGAVRILPWLFDPAIPWRVAKPFARGLVAIALEASFLVGWPLGWALGCERWIARGEALALESLGERPSTAAFRLAPQAVVLGLLLATASIAWGRDASAPGRVAGELVGEAKRACASARAPTTYAVPFVDLAWLCAPPHPPRLLAHANGALASSFVTASDATIAGDFRQIVLRDARTQFASIDVRANELVLRGLPPWSRAATLAPIARAALLVASAMASSFAVVFALLGGDFGQGRISRKLVRDPSRKPGRFDAVVLGVTGPLVVLGVLRALERSDARAATFLVAPFAGFLATLAVAVVLLRLPRRGTAATK